LCGFNPVFVRLLSVCRHPQFMIDLIYVLGTIGFFALMLLYVRACERLGRDTTDRTENTP